MEKKKHRIITEHLVPVLVAPSVCLDIVHFLHFVGTKLADHHSLTNVLCGNCSSAVGVSAAHSDTESLINSTIFDGSFLFL